MPSKSKRNDKEDNLKLISDQNEKLDLIKVNVDNVKKDVDDISVYTQKQISAIGKALDREISKFDELQQKVKKANGEMTRQTQDSLNRIIGNIDVLSQKMTNANKKNKKEQEDLHKSLKQLDKEIFEEKVAPEREKAAQDYINKISQQVKKENEKTNSMIASLSTGKLGSVFSSLGSKSINKKSETNEEGLEKLVEAYKNNKVSETDFKSGVQKFSQTASKYETATALLTTLGNTLDKVIKLWTDRFFNGMDKIIGEYENVFTSQAVMTGVSQREYQQWQNSAVKDLTEQGLQNNVAITDVMEQTSKFVDSGITNFAKASELGQQAALRGILAPYLDQNSETLTSLELSMPGISKSLSGVGNFVSDTVGQNRFTVKNLQKLIDLTEPVSLAAKKDLLGAEGLAMIEDLVKGGMDMESATKMATDIASAVADPLGAGLESGNVAIASAVASGERSFTGIAKSAMGTQASLQAGTDGDLGTAAMLQATGGWGAYNYDASGEFSRVIKNAEEGKYSNGTTTSTGEPDTSKNYEELTKQLANDQLQTTKDMKDILAQNISTNLATLAEKFPDTYSVLKDLGSSLVGTLIGFLGGKFVEKIGGKVLGKIGKGLISGGGKLASGAKSLAETGYLKALYAKDALSASKVGSGLKAAFTTTGKSGLTSVLSSTGAKVLGGVGGAIMTVKDAVGGYKKADQWFEKDNNGQPATTGQKVSSVIGGALGGTGPGVFDKNASAGDKVKNVLGGAAKGAAIGTMFGPVGTAVGGLVGAGLSAIGGENISKGLSKMGEGIKNVASAVGGFISDRWNDMKEMGSKVGETVGKMWDSAKEGFGQLADNAANAFGNFVTFLTGIPEKIVKVLEFGIDSFITGVQNMFSTIINIPIFLAKTAVGVVNGLKNSIKSWVETIPAVGGTVASWFPDDIPSPDYIEMQEMPSFSSYATGSDYIEKNGEVAYLHEGEAVLTKPAATLLRANTDYNASSVAGVSDALTSSSTINSNGFNLVVSAINDQTSQLLSKMDQMLSIMSSGKTNTSYNSKLVNLEGRLTSNGK